MGIRLVLSPLSQTFKDVSKSTLMRLRCRYSGARIARYVNLSNVHLADYVNIAHHAELANTSVGKRTSVGRYTKVRDAVIGAYCSISWGVTIGAVGHPLDHLSSHAFSYRRQFGIVEHDELMPSKQVTIGNDVWIGCDSILMPGVTIGNGAVIGAGAVVTKDVKPYAIVSGVPAKLMRYRFDRELIDALELLCWWDWDDDFLRSHISFFKSPINLETLEVLIREKQ